MPVRITQTITAPLSGNVVEMNPFVGTVGHTSAVPLNVANLTTAEVDSYGYLRPGVPVDAGGNLIATTVPVFGVTLEAIRVAKSNAAADLTAAGTVQVAVGTIGQINRAIAEHNIGRTYTTAEVAGFGLAPCTIKLLA